ncbi:MAG: DUF222 domain-containing protein [Acidimicrobiales bacterium]
MRTSPILVAGEPADVILKVLIGMRDNLVPDADGMTSIQATIPQDHAAVLLRATMRIEAELLLADAKEVGSSAAEPRTPQQRRADAFVALALRVADALGGSKS